MIGDKAMTEFELTQRLNFEIGQLEMLSRHSKELVEHYESENEYYKKRLASIENFATAEPLATTCLLYSTMGLSAYHLNFIHKQLEKTQKRLEKLNEDIALNGVEL